LFGGLVKSQGLPAYFCQKHLPKSDKIITLVDEEDDKFCMHYQPSKAVLSTGWKGFAIEHKLLGLPTD
jgi:hypothetical protein